MQVALQKLDYKFYHMIEEYHIKAMKYWLETLRAKYVNEKVPYQRVEFDKLLEDYSVRRSSWKYLVIVEIALLMSWRLKIM